MNRTRIGRLAGSLHLFPVLRHTEAVAGRLRGALAAISVTAALAGFAEAAVLVIVAAVATNLGSGTDGQSASSWMDDRNLTNGDLLLVGVALVALALALQLIVGWASSTIYTRSIARARMGVVEAHAHATWPAKEELSTSTLVQLAIQSANKVGELVQAMTSLASAGANFAALLISALLIDLTGAIAISIGVAVLLAFTMPLVRTARRLNRSLVGKGHEYTAVVHEYAAIGREVQTFGVQSASIEAIGATSDDHANELRRARFVGYTSTGVFKSAALLLIISLLAVVTRGGAEDIASYAAVSLILLRSVSYGQALQSNWHLVLAAAPWAEDLEEKRDALLASWDEATGPRPEDELASAHRAPHEQPTTAQVHRTGPVSIVLRDVTFRYQDNDPVFDGFDLDIPAGQYVGIVGSSGAGKTTLAELVLGLRWPERGQVIVDGENLRTVSRDAWNRRTAFVAQEPAMIRGTIRDNVRFYRPWIGDDALDAALQAARVLTDVRYLPQGLDTDTGTLGNRLSGGQRQRITIARALADDPGLLVLDEPTSALDPASEAHIAATLDDLRGRATVMVIAHRWTTLARCDRVIALGRGGVVADGSPDLLNDLAGELEMPVGALDQA